MVSPTPAPAIPSGDAVEFVRFCYRRRRVGWPELYDEMCAVGSRGLFRGWGVADLAEHGIGFSLFAMPALATLVGQVVAEEQANTPKRAAFSIGHLAGSRADDATRAAGVAGDDRKVPDRSGRLVALGTS